LWIEEHFVSDFLHHRRRLSELLDLLESLKTSHFDATNRIKLTLLRSSGQLHTHSNGDLDISVTKERLPKCHLFDYSSSDVAEQLTLLEFRIFQSIRPEEFYNKGWLDAKRSPNLHLLVSRANQVAYWVASTILMQRSIHTQERAACRFIMIAHLCEQIGNYNGLMAVLGGFQLWCISRLRKMWQLDQRFSVLLRHLELLMAPNGNYAKYRAVMGKRAKRVLEGDEATLPYLGLFLKDLTFIEDGNADQLDDGKINKGKIAMIGSTLRGIRALQSGSFAPIKASIMHLLQQLAALPHLSEDELNQRSQAIRPVQDSALSSTLSAASSDSSVAPNEVNSDVLSAADSSSSSDVSEMLEMPIPEGGDSNLLAKYMQRQRQRR